MIEDESPHEREVKLSPYRAQAKEHWIRRDLLREESDRESQPRFRKSLSFTSWSQLRISRAKRSEPKREYP